ncbi:DUF3310 domain-containing protein [Sutterella wadsworthensis]|uniref:DUF3310 domain-containing protein n=1 Tax=Sutterella wadsworthensis TaxID=40545 RepID=UPI003AEFD135
MTEENDLVNHPAHYEKCRVAFEVVDLTERLPHSLGSAVEYILRAPYKGTERLDLQKAVWWLKRFRDVGLRQILKADEYTLAPTAKVVMSAFCLTNNTLNLLVARDNGVLYVSIGTLNRTIEKLEKRIAEIEKDD